MREVNIFDLAVIFSLANLIAHAVIYYIDTQKKNEVSKKFLISFVLSAVAFLLAVLAYGVKVYFFS